MKIKELLVLSNEELVVKDGKNVVQLKIVGDNNTVFAYREAAGQSLVSAAPRASHARPRTLLRVLALVRAVRFENRLRAVEIAGGDFHSDEAQVVHRRRLGRGSGRRGGRRRLLGKGARCEQEQDCHRSETLHRDLLFRRCTRTRSRKRPFHGIRFPEEILHARPSPSRRVTNRAGERW